MQAAMASTVTTAACGRRLEHSSRATFRTSQPVCLRPACSAGRGRAQRLVVRADRDRDGSGFATGFVLGGVIFGTLGFLFAPQISAALLGEDQKLKLPRFLEDEADPEATKADLRDKIEQLNKAIDEISGQLAPTDAEKSTA